MEWTGARYADNPTVEARTWIDAQPERVWEIVADIRLMPEFSAELQSVEWLNGATGPEIGNSFIGRNKHESRGEWETTSYVISCERPRVFAWAVADPDTPTATWRFTLDHEDGGTTLRQWARMGPARSGLNEAIDRMPDKEQKIVFSRMREFENSITRTLAAIKKHVEGSEAVQA